MLTLVTGLSNSGKTTLPKLFNKKLPWNYAVYSKEQILLTTPVHEIKISKAVRKEVIGRINKNLEKDLNDDKYYEKSKDKIVLSSQIGESTYRELLETAVREKRKTDLFYYIRHCYDSSINGNNTSNLMITDFRYPEEEKFLSDLGFHITTIRIFRQVPTLEEKYGKRFDSEHGLDNFLTDFLLVPLNNYEENFREATSVYKQYKKYKRCKNVYYV